MKAKNTELKTMNTEKHRFFVPIDLITEDRIVFPIEEARHATKVLRIAKGDLVTVIDGAGGTYTAEMEVVGNKGAIAAIVSKEVGLGESTYAVRMSVGMIKHAARWETFLEKAVELGVTRITPLISERMQKSAFNERRAWAIMIAALKQSGRSKLPQLDQPTKIKKLLQEEVGEEVKMICHESSPDAPSISKLLRADTSNVHILVGPEGGFSQEEITLANEAGWTTVWMGERRLRTETAAITSLAVVSQYLNGAG